MQPYISIQQWIEYQAAKNPDRTAVLFEGETLSYGSLNSRANKVAWELRKMGVVKETAVGVLLSRGFNLIIVVLGVLKSGGCFVPLDPKLPEYRKQYILVDSKVKLLITERVYLERFVYSGATLVMEKVVAILNGDANNPPSQTSSEDLAYIMYTSGSSGKPKGVMIEHRSIINFAQGIRDCITWNGISRVLCVTTVSFDIFVLESLVPLAFGLEVVLANEEQQNHSVHLGRLIREASVEVIQMTPSRLRMLLLHRRSATSLKSVKMVLVGGEPFSMSLLNKLRMQTQARIYNLYGPTETTIWSSVSELTNASEVSIGTPIQNTEFILLGEDLKEVPIGEVGEIYILGKSLARGYFGNQDLTSHAFINLIKFQGQRAYKSGDLGRQLSDGSFVCLGRIDRQVKVKGHRVEIEEIERMLLQVTKAKQAAVIAVQEEEYTQLIAFLIYENQVPASNVRQSLEKLLPEYMIPSVFKIVENIPLTLNGKIDYSSLLTHVKSK